MGRRPKMVSRSVPVNGLPPSRRVSVQTSFFMPSIRLDPGAAGFAPARRAGDGFFEAELIGEFRGVEKGVFPFGSHVDETLVDDLRSVEGRVEILEAADADSMHPFEIELDAFLGDVAVHPVPPDARLRGGRRTLKILEERVLRLLRDREGCDGKDDRD